MYVTSVIAFYLIFALCHVVGEQEKDNHFNGLVKRTLIATAHACMETVDATTEDIEKLRGDPPYPEKSACILKCLLEKVGVIRSNKYSKAGFMTAVTPLIFTNRKKLEHMKSVSENCDKEVNHSHETPCQVGNEVITCIFKYAPELHFKS